MSTAQFVFQPQQYIETEDMHTHISLLVMMLKHSVTLLKVLMV